MNVSRATIGLALAVCLVLSGCSSSHKPAEASSLKPEGKRKAAPEFSLRDINGKNVSLSEYRGKIVLLNFWATWCGPCKMEIPWFADFEQKYKSKGFAVIGVSMDEDGWDSVKPFVEHMHMNYRVVLGNDSIADIYGGVSALPTTFLIDRQGRIVAAHEGLVSKGDYESEIDELLQTSSSAVLGNSRPLLARAR